VKSAFAALLAIHAAMAPGAAQERSSPRSFPELLRAIAGADDEARTRKIDRFLVGRAADDSDTLKARLLRASDRLRGFSLRLAAEEFRRVLAAVPRRERDLAARALYGIAQCEELLGRIKPCTDALQRLKREFRDLRHARFAEASLRRLQSRDALAVGRPAPVFTVSDVTGRSHSSSAVLGRPMLIVFFAPNDAESVVRVSRLLQAFCTKGGRVEDAMLFAIERDVARLRSFAKNPDQRSKQPGKNRSDDQPGLGQSTLVPCSGAFLDPVLVQFRVQALPDSFLVGPDGTLLLRSPTPAAVRRALVILSDK
jgi:hypothetical protein